MADRIDKVLTGYDIPSELFSEAMKRCNEARDNFIPLIKRSIYSKEKAEELDKIVKKKRETRCQK